MAQILYNRQADQPDLLYLPIGSDFIQLVEGMHTYPDEKAAQLQQSVNPVVRNMIQTGIISIRLDGQSTQVAVPKQTFAPLEIDETIGSSERLQLDTKDLTPTNEIKPIEQIETRTPELIESATTKSTRTKK